MKLFSIISFILVFTQLFGCSNLPTQPDESSTSAGNDTYIYSIYYEEPIQETVGKSAPSATEADGQIDLSQQQFPDLWQRIKKGFNLNVDNNSRIASAMGLYTRSPRYFERISERADPWLYHIVQELEKRGMPLEIALLPAVESAFQPKAVSPKAAAGIWQFIPSTGELYGLKQTSLYDGRRDVLAATDAALNYLQKLHEEFDGDWLAAIAAYNCGEGNVRRAIERNIAAGKPTDYWSLDLPTETEHYVPRLLAMSRIVANPEAYGINTLKPIANRPSVAQVDIGNQISLDLAADLAGISAEDLKRLNPAYKSGITDPTGPHCVTLPVEKVHEFKQKLVSISAQELISEEERRRSFLARDNSEESAEETPKKTRSAKTTTNNRVVATVSPKNQKEIKQTTDKHTIKRGETLAEIAKRYNTTVKELQRLNKGLSSSRLKLNTTIVIPEKTPRQATVLNQDKDNKNNKKDKTTKNPKTEKTNTKKPAKPEKTTKKPDKAEKADKAKDSKTKKSDKDKKTDKDKKVDKKAPTKATPSKSTSAKKHR